uniref:Peptidase S1 domain-containing protein n=2 Tax=Corethron hystrix TaxID=216773 RepID=A0A7S1FN56_9STRA|mmetsp:Transcript_14455/g.31768  ORF Transcript_14455/g.31768 Transcript_14455/m.31768 type:complete len:127 (+) Transcript_14455:307-687(+)
MGWGKCAVYFGCYSSWKLKHGDLRVKAQDSCQLTFGTTYSQRYSICARDPAEKTADCNGDSGGPVVKKGATAREDVLVGIVSYGPHNCLSGPFLEITMYHLLLQLHHQLQLQFHNQLRPLSAKIKI